MEARDIQILLQAFNATDLTKMAYSKDNFSLVLERQSGQSFVAETLSSAAPEIHPAPASGPSLVSPAPLAPVSPTLVSPVMTSQEDLVKAPLVGVFYPAPAPDAAPFVTIGQKITRGQTLCIVEAMKVMNEIQAEWDGVVEQIMANPEDIVEYGQPLFSVRRAG